MKYDRPVWQIMHLCADAMPEVFRYDDVRNWFATNYPDVNEATIRAHLIGLTEGGRAKHVQFAARSPIFRRVARGEYEAIPLTERAEDPNAPTPSPSKIKMSGNGRSPGALMDVESSSTHDAPVVTDGGVPHVADIILLGSVGDRVNVPAPAKEIFREVSFQLSRLDAELSGSDWFILSAEHGLVAPNEWISPDSRTLADMEPEYRSVWASWVVARLQSLVGSLDGTHVRVDAPNAFIGPLFADLQDAGAIVTSGTLSVTFPTGAELDAGGADLAVADDEPADDGAPTDEDPDDEAPMDETPEDEAPEDDVPSVDVQRAEVPLHQVPSDAVALEQTELVAADRADDDVEMVPTGAPSPVSAHLIAPRHRVPATETRLLPNAPGLYAWFVDPLGARMLNRCLKLPVREGLVFVGQVGGSSWHSMADPVLNVRDHVERIQLHGRTRASTFRMTLATVLGEHLGMTSLEDPRLTEWMMKHLSVSAWSSEHVGRLGELEQLVVAELDPPLNVDHLPATEYRSRLNQMRRFLG
ncbi:MAG: DUF6884 domain-containing protein [Aeromicrobium sp.]